VLGQLPQHREMGDVDPLPQLRHRAVHEEKLQGRFVRLRLSFKATPQRLGSCRSATDCSLSSSPCAGA
jgi:hypothetical protein